MGRIEKHPILSIPKRRDIAFTFNGQKLTAKEGEVISSALFAHGIHVFGHHPHDGAPQGIYCANGQCSQCMVIANGIPVKACMTMVKPEMEVQACNGYPEIPPEENVPRMGGAPTIDVPCLIIGGGPAGLSAAIELAKFGVRAILVDDKHILGGKLTLQTHNFFGSRGDCYAGTRGIDIAALLEEELRTYGKDLVDVWLNSPAVGVYCDGKVGIVKQGTYVLVKPEILLVAAGAREKALAFPGCDLPGVYGAGAFQTLVNRDLVRPTERLFICGGGNVGLIGGYHALQAGIDVMGLVEALPECGGYQVHLDKLRRLGVPIYTSHTVHRAEGKGRVERVTICQIDERFHLLPGTEKAFEVDTLLIAVGLSPVNEMAHKAKAYGMKVVAAGDAEEIAEASAAMFSGRRQGRNILRELRHPCVIPKEWDGIITTLRGKPGPRRELRTRTLPGKVFPLIRCIQEISCNPCVEACPRHAITIKDGTLTGLPSFEGDSCLGCARCVLACPGLAIVLVDETYDPAQRQALLTVPIELTHEAVGVGEEVTTVGLVGEPVGTGRVIAFRDAPSQDRRRLVLLEVPFEDRLRIAGIQVREGIEGTRGETADGEQDVIVCRCERVTKGEILKLIRAGYRDMNQIKAALRTGMGACGGKTCTELILGLFREEGVDLKEVTLPVQRPPEMEIPLGVFAGVRHQ
jgi:NADPH-dependent 2,4-dienoyl-CoA reductase/sulfur reductase-like enzyme/ferredoxin